MRSIQQLLQYKLPLAARWLVLCLLMALPLTFAVSQYQPGEGFTALIFFGSDFQAQASSRLVDLSRASVPGPGYDGQFYAQMALDPLLRDPSTLAALDNPAYRARRIFVPLLAYLAGFGQPLLILQSYALINLVFFAALLLGLYAFQRPGSVQEFLIVAAIAWTGGALASVSRALIDLPASVLLLLACFLPPNLAKLSMVAALLTRETSLVSLLVFLWPGSPRLAIPTSSEQPPNPRQARAAWIWQWLRAALLLLPLAIWLLYVDARLPGASAGGLLGSNNFSLPFLAWGQHILDSIRSMRPSAMGEIAACLSLGAQAIYLIAFPRQESPIWRMGIGFALLYFCLGSAVFVNQLAYGRVVLPLTFAFNLLLWQKEARGFLLWFLAGNAGIALGFATSLLF